MLELADSVLDLPSHWRGKEGIFGGYVLARFCDAAENAVPDRRPLSATVQFVSALRPGPMVVTTEVLHAGRLTSNLRIEVRQDDRLRAHASVILVHPAAEPDWQRRADLADVPAPDALASDASGTTYPYAAQLDIRRTAPASIEAGSAAWIRFAAALCTEEVRTTRAVAAVYLDAMDPGAFTLAPPPEFVPTIDFTAHFSPALDELSPHELAGSWSYIVNRTVWADARFCVEESTLHGHDGIVLAQVRQGRAIRPKKVS
jgi:acyl-CoA thioesterase